MENKLTEEQISKGNKVITDYMGAKVEKREGRLWMGVCYNPGRSDKTWWTLVHSEQDAWEGIYRVCAYYHKDWNWLIPIIKKVLKDLDNIQDVGDELYRAIEEYEEEIRYTVVNDNIEIAFNTTVKMVEIINTQKND